MNLNFSFTQLRYIIAVEKFKNFVKAAKSCGVSQPSLSMQIQKLEQELGTTIFDRSKNPITTTDIGKKILKQAKITLKQKEMIGEIILADKTELSGELRIAIIPTISTYLIPLFLKIVQKNFPNMQLNIEEQTTEQILENLNQDKIDGGILATPLYRDNLIERHLYYEEFFVYVNDQHPLHLKKDITSKEMTNYAPWILTEGHCFRNQTLDLCNYKQRTNQNIHFESGSFETLIRIVDKEGGFTIIPRMALEFLTTSQKKNIRNFKTPIPTREVSLVHERIFLKESLLNALEKAVLDGLPQYISTNKQRDFRIIDI